MTEQKKPMEHHKLVMPEHLNPHGFLFGGYLLHWIDELAYITAMLEFPGYKLVTIGMENVEFKQSIHPGEVLRFDVKQIRLGNTSVRYHVEVYGEVKCEDPQRILFETNITFVSVDGEGGVIKING